MKKNLMLIAMAVLFAGLTSCNNYGEKLMFDTTELYYTDKVTEDEANDFGKYLQESGFTDGDETKTVQLTKDGDTYQFRMVVKDGYDKDEDYELIAQAFAYNISEDVFDGDDVEIHLCDENLKTLKVVKMEEVEDSGYDVLEFDGTEIQFDGSVTKSDVKAVGNYLIESGFTDGTTKSIILVKEYGVFVFKMVSSEDYWGDKDFIALIREFAGMISADALNNEPVEIQLCDEYFETQVNVSMD